ncbi:hypothetical protein O181_018070 [Austropuccinia psidii MF-1]|uniref:Lysophospholipase n=1 Tax=Austropuccinia psidii MF-1 TaxID=1389203 RepID=A0A9Q3C7Z9_9BASI|nr:hypothetical protein [Austropuccinia psidii MF-1]
MKCVEKVSVSLFWAMYEINIYRLHLIFWKSFQNLRTAEGIMKSFIFAWKFGCVFTIVGTTGLASCNGSPPSPPGPDHTLPSLKGYAPVRISCPANLSVITSETYPWPTSPAEQNYISNKAKKSLDGWAEYLSRAKLTDFNVTAFIQGRSQGELVPGKTLPNVAFALSGGGNRALLYAASVLNAFDARNPRALEAGTGGLLQVANFIAGLSSSSWLLASWGNADFIQFPQLAETAWESAFDHGYLNWRRLKSFPRHYSDLKKKRNAGFHTSIVEYIASIALALIRTCISYDIPTSRMLMMKASGGDYCLKISSYINHTFPFPILVSTSRKGEGEELDLSSPIYEFTTEDFNVWNPALNASIPIEYLGSQVATWTGKFVQCNAGFDNLGFLMGASSNIFSYQDGKQTKRSFLNDLLSLFIEGKVYEALVPNPFCGRGLGLTPGSGFADAEIEELLLADGAMAQESLPLFPLLQPARGIDVIVAVDSTVDGRSFDNAHAQGYPNGSALYRTSLKLEQFEYRNYKYPKIPETYRSTSFIRPGYNKRPTFFGCGEDAPMVVYLPNYYVTQATNHSTMHAIYSKDDISGYFENGHYVATQTHPSQNGTDWSACLACALVDKQNSRDGVPRTAQCQACFVKYCASH